MTGASKILTVSYGTFSCTLEGFDDPFNTMKAIAEYFRDLAAEDRYFGAEPPTPDAAMLHRIAEREIQRRVEAKVQENGIVLRAAEGDGPSDAPFAVAPAMAPDAPRLMEQTVAATESVAEKLSRLRADVAGQTPAPAPQPAAAAVQTAPVLTTALAPAPAYTVPDFVAPDFGDEDGYDLPAGLMQDEDDVAAQAGDADTATPGPERRTPDAYPEPQAAAPASDPVDAAPDATDTGLSGTDALLAGLMAGLAQPTAPAAAAAPDAAPAPADTDDLSSIFGADAEDDTAPDALSGDMTEAEAFDLGAIDAGAEAEDGAAQDSIFGADFEDAAEAADLSGAEALYAAGETAADAGAVSASGFDAEPETDDLADPDFGPEPDRLDDDATVGADAVPAMPPAPSDLRADASDKLQRARARVIRIRRTDPEGVTQAPPPVAGDAMADASLSAEAEADLAAELAALSAADTVAAAEDDATAAAAEARRAFDDSSADATISRLMAQADEHLEGPENKRRLSAIAHLKAAVAATVAERRATGPAAKDAEPSRLSRYRDDLARAVRGVTSGDAAQPERPAPLVLVSEQRIDRPRPVAVPTPAPQARPAAPAAAVSSPAGGTVVPRRLSGSAGLAFAQEEDEEFAEPVEAIADTRGFVEFAERLGATSLAELIEASAAYLACVEGRDQFTRPQLMGLVQVAMPDGDIPREDGLRSFGTLLRTGRIEKIRRGQFALSETSGYLAEGRRIAG